MTILIRLINCSSGQVRNMERTLEAQAKVDEEICMLKERINELLTFRNSIALINQLPAEIFVQIFKSCQPPSVGDPRDIDDDDTLEFDEWLRITQVCQRWRSIAFDAKEFWTTIPTHNDVYAELAFKLSDPLPISILDTAKDMDVDNLRGSSHDLYYLLLDRAEKVEVRSPTGQSYLLYALRDAPSVQELILENLELTNLSRSSLPVLLRSLTVSNCPTGVDWGWLELEHLTELRIDISDIPDQVDISWFIDRMQHLPSLCLLEVVNLFESDSGGSSRRLSLKRLLISDAITLASTFLAYVDFRPDFTLMAELLYHDTLDEGQNFMQILDHHLQGAQRIIRHAVLNCDQDTDGRNGRGFSCQFFDWDLSNPFLHIRTNSTTIDPGIWLDLIQTLHWDQLQHLSVEAIKGVQGWQTWPLRDLHFLRELYIHDTQSFDGFFKCLASDTVFAEESNNWDHVLFPALKELTLRDIRFKQQEKVRLAHILNIRRIHGYGLEQLSFVDGNLTSEPDGTELITQAVDKLIVTTQRKGRDWRRKL